MEWLLLGLAIVAEVIATSALKASDGFSRLLPSLVVVGGYGIAFAALSFALKTIPVGVAYAIWSGVGVVLISLVAWLLMGQQLDRAALGGMALIVLGVMVINLFSDTVRRPPEPVYPAEDPPPSAAARSDSASEA